MTLSKLQSLKERSVLITGSGSGIGIALSEHLADEGASVMLADIDQARAEQLAVQLREKNYAVDAVHCDVGNADDAENAVHKTTARFGKIDVLINNAGMDVTCSLCELEVAQWERVLRTNLHGPFLMARAAARHMMGQGSGTIVNITSTAAKRAWPNACAYHASKKGLLGLSHALHAELRPAGIKVVAVVCGGMAAPVILGRFPDIDTMTVQDPANVALTISQLLQLPDETVVPEITVLPMNETSWP